MTSPVIAIVGPTASGKSNVAQEIALALDGEVISADSMQIYRGMDIGTGKLSPAERLVPHHGLDLIDPGQPYSAALFQTYARACIDDIQGRGKQALLAGGTGFYVAAAVDAYDFPPGEQVDNPVRSHWTEYAEKHGEEALWKHLHEVDPASAACIHPHNVRRVVRALEMFDEGTSYAEQKRRLSSIGSQVETVFFGLSVEPSVLRKRIDDRVDAMVEAGLVDEVTSLLNEGYRDGVTAPQAIGYKEIVRALDGECTLQDAIADIKTATHRYAKRQRSWFRRDKRIQWVDADEGDAKSLARVIIQHLTTSSREGTDSSSWRIPATYD